MTVGSVTLTASLFYPNGTSSSGSSSSSSSSSSTTTTTAVAFQSATTAKAAFLSTLLSQRFDAVGFENSVSALQTATSAFVSSPLQVSTLDSWLALSGFTPTLSSDTASTVAGFASDLTQITTSLGDSASTQGDVAAGTSAALQAGITGAVAATYVVDTGIVDPSTAASTVYDPNSTGTHVVTPASIGFTSSDGTVSYDSATFAAAYSADPFTTVATFNALANALGTIADGYPNITTWQQDSSSATTQQAALAYLASSALT